MAAQNERERYRELSKILIAIDRYAPHEAPPWRLQEELNLDIDNPVASGAFASDETVHPIMKYEADSTYLVKPGPGDVPFRLTHTVYHIKGAKLSSGGHMLILTKVAWDNGPDDVRYTYQWMRRTMWDMLGKYTSTAGLFTTPADGDAATVRARRIMDMMWAEIKEQFVVTLLERKQTYKNRGLRV